MAAFRACTASQFDRLLPVVAPGRRPRLAVCQFASVGSACAGVPTTATPTIPPPPPATVAPQAPAREPAVTDPPATDPPEEDPPETAPPETDPPETDPPETDPPEPVQPQPLVPQTSGGSVYYDNCTEARAAGAAPIYRGDPGYRPKLDGNNNGVACEDRK